jgi:outer membrane protein assembly factor BamB
MFQPEFAMSGPWRYPFHMVGCRWILVFNLACSVPAFGADWPQWRGPHRDGTSSETGLLQSWPAGGPRLVWKTQGLGEGYSSFAVVGDRLYTQGQQGNQEFVVAFDTKTGKLIWKTPSGRAFHESRGHGPRGTPTIEGARLYALAADGTLVCLEAATGQRIWGMNLIERFGGRVPTWGISESPLIDGDRVIVTPGGPGASVVALETLKGDLLWKSQSDSAGYSSPIAFDAGGSRKVVVFTARGAIALDIKNGEFQWRYDKVANRVANIATPIVRDNYVFLSSDYGTGCALLKLTAGAKAVNASEVYFNRDMRNHYTTSVLVGDYLYGFSSGILTAMKFLTGEVAWRDRSVGKGNVIYAEGNLYAFGEDGVMGLVQATPEGYKEKSRFEIHKGSYPTWTPPVIANGKLYLRDQDNLYCYDIKR